MRIESFRGFFGGIGFIWNRVWGRLSLRVFLRIVEVFMVSVKGGRWRTIEVSVRGGW